VLKESPAGRVGEMEKAIGAVPPLAVTGVKLAAAVPALIVWVAIARVVDSAAEIVSANVLALVALLASVAVTV
jgi:hypothetical protein